MNPCLSILVVEDSATQALGLSLRLESQGWNVSCVAAGEAALEKLNLALPDLVIVSSHLRGIGAEEFCMRVRGNASTRKVPILMLTSEEPPEQEQPQEDDGQQPPAQEGAADLYVPKSDPIAMLQLQIRALVSLGSRYETRARRAGFVGSGSRLSRRARLLAIDDSPTSLEHLAQVLLAEGYEVTKAADGLSALRRLERETFDCIMVDLVMPEMDGIEVCRRIRTQTPLRPNEQEAAVVMLTSSETKEDMTRSLEAGADDFVGKSSDVAVLKARIRALLRRKFSQEENSRIVAELKNKELEAARARAERETELNRALKLAYDELRQTQEAVMQQERLRALGQMASGIAHDINNAISPVALYTEALLAREPGLSPRTRKYLEITQRAMGDVAHTVGQMREFYRGRQEEITLLPVDLNSLAKQVLDLTRARWSDMALQRGAFIAVTKDFSDQLNPVAGLESEIREALTNLIFNAVDAMPDGGTLTIRTGSLQPDRCYVEVTDTGMGMDEETRLRCLEPFFTTKGERGTGLGLAMVYGVVRRHNGQLDIESRLGHGSTFRFTLMATEASASLAPPPDLAPLPLRLLLVDDDPALLDCFQEILESDGHQVLTANGGEEGIRVFEEAVAHGEPFKAVLTDLGMPHVDGRKVAIAVKACSPMTPVILLTGWGQKMLAEGTAPEGVDCIVGKPPKLADLRRALAACTRSVAAKQG